MIKKIEVNGYKIPGQRGGIALWKALYNVLNNPGISQKHQLADAASFSSLNHSTLGWLTSPGTNSPAGKLWDRRKEGVFRLYPNQWTQNAFDHIPHPDEVLSKEMRLRVKDTKLFKTGDCLLETVGPSQRRVTFVNYAVSDGGKYDQGCLVPNSERVNYFENPDEIIATIDLKPYVANPDWPSYSIQQHLKAQVLVDGKFEVVFHSFLSAV